MQELHHEPFLHTGKKCGLYVSPYSENSVQFTGMKNNHIPKNSDLWRIFTQAQQISL